MMYKGLQLEIDGLPVKITDVEFRVDEPASDLSNGLIAGYYNIKLAVRHEAAELIRQGIEAAIRNAHFRLKAWCWFHR